ncbi:hypothetical protein GOP47_0012976 [Adiantum capillus-veneris]|uniref:Protein kinase domain-containing protein n=1 Tax=Adiantum capillus-veneris TaxID=13818 RepID=A0A9D4URQ2_ADICA|nr:hypothetical protein GOP47_0012976 [Adiantum capillus-veneris]
MGKNSSKLQTSFSSRQTFNYPIRHMIITIIGLFFVFSMPLHEAQSIHPSQSFSFASFADHTNITFVQQDSWYGGELAVPGSNGTILLNPDPSTTISLVEANIGKMVYKDPIRFKFPKYGMVSFSTSFTFKITTTGDYPNGGSGMVFFISDYKKAPMGSYGRYFGMVSPTALNAQRFFAVEFDTRNSTNLGDVSDSHIGIDINSLESLNSSDTSPNSKNPSYYPQLFLYNNYTFTAWVDYNSSTNLIEVWMTNSSTSQRPSTTILSHKYDLSNVFNDTMFVGFSATNNVSEDGMEGHALFSWNFTIHYPIDDEHAKGTGSVLKLALIGVGVGIVAILVCCACFLIWKRNKKSKLGRNKTVRPHSGSVVISMDHSTTSVALYTLKQLKKATSNFSNDNQIGEGGYSFVYKGVLEDGTMIAVKRLKGNLKKDRREAEFLSELKVISNTRHRNLLQLQGWCCENEEALLVYNYMSKGSLDRYLYGSERGTLARDTRLRILEGVASALQYLHSGLGDCVLHRDVKAANVLLTDDFQSMLCDFGLARLISHSQADAITMTAAGTTGYIAPEVVFSGKFSDKADVYGFGVLALEVASGRPAIDRYQLNLDEVRLVEWVWNLHLSNKLIEALDSCMRLDISTAQEEQWKGVLHLALMCCNPSAESRPNMRQVCQTLDGDNVLLRQPLPRSKAWAPPPPNEMWPSASESSNSACLAPSQ